MIDDKHEQFIEYFDQWQTCRDFVAGAWKLREHENGAGGGETAYIEKLSPKQSTAEYRKYVKRALYDNVARRMKNSLLGLAFAKPPVYKVSPEYIATDIDMKETALEEFAEGIVDEVLIVGRCGVLIDRPQAKEGTTIADAEAENIRPYAVLYKAESIVNWETARIGNRWKVSRVVLHQAADRYMELYLDDTSLYHVAVWVKPENGDWMRESDIVPLVGGKAQTEIPFYFFGPYSGTPEVVESPILDIVEIACSRWRTSADLEHARFSCSLPTPYFLGFTDEEASRLSLGGLNGIVATSTEAKVGFLEYNGQGTEPLERAMQQKAEMMARHGVDLLQDKADAEAVETVKMRIGVQTATLADMANSMSRIMVQMLSFMSIWAGGAGGCEFALNTDYSAHGLSAQDLLALVQGVVTGTVSQAVLNERLRKAGLEDRTDEEIAEDLALKNEEADL
jgi:hypothetical protein